MWQCGLGRVERCPRADERERHREQGGEEQVMWSWHVNLPVEDHCGQLPQASAQLLVMRIQHSHQRRYRMTYNLRSDAAFSSQRLGFILGQHLAVNRNLGDP